MDRIVDVLSQRPLSRWDLVDQGFERFWPYLFPCRVKILIVVDDNISFSHAYFGLSHVIDVLANNPEFFVKFDVTRAHRQIDNFKPNQAADPLAWARHGPHFEGFRFTQAGFDINAYDQVWCFGFNGEGGPASMSDAELEIVARWMDAGGGLFAVGDHYDLGAALCSAIPRVRSMRLWTGAQGAPHPDGPDRHDTLLKGTDAGYTFDDESDDKPMPITPRYYNLASWSPFVARRAPHPLLCGTDGVIDIFPDHPHEGHVRETSTISLTQAFSFGSYINRAEYPTAGGVQAVPEVVAWADVRGDHSPTDFKGSVNATRFGVVGAYDGHQSAVGRVVVDSTWHHWFDVNLTGRPVPFLDSLP